MITHIDKIFEGTRYRIKDLEKARLFRAICSQDGPSRQQLAETLTIRPSSVGIAVGELIRTGLVRERTAGIHGGPGRPERVLTPVMDRCYGIALYVEVQQLHGMVVNLDEKLGTRQSVHIPQDADNRYFMSACQKMINLLMGEMRAGSECIGVGISLVGTVNACKKTWISSARWPAIRDLNMTRLQKQFSCPIQVNRSLDSELEHILLKKPEYRGENILLFHWGYGIGSAYAYQGTVIQSSVGRFGEIGHTRVAAGRNRQCLCGSTGCLETEAALWAIVPRIHNKNMQIPENEHAFSLHFKHSGLLEHKIIKNAVACITDSVVNLYKIFYPDRILFIGPFTEQTEIFSQISHAVSHTVPSFPREAFGVTGILADLRVVCMEACSRFLGMRFARYLSLNHDIGDYTSI